MQCERQRLDLVETNFPETNVVRCPEGNSSNLNAGCKAESEYPLKPDLWQDECSAVRPLASYGSGIK